MGRSDVTVLRAAVAAEWAAKFAPALQEFDVFWPGYPKPLGAGQERCSLGLDEALLAAKMAAFRAHASQLRPLFEAYGETFLRALCSVELFHPLTLPAPPGSVQPLLL